VGKRGPKPLTYEQVVARFWSRVRKTDGCWLWTGNCTKWGYGQFQARGLSDQPIYAHRFAYELQRGPIPDGEDVLHTCDNPPCMRGDHFFTGTQSDNSKDMIAKGRLKIGGNWRRFRDAQSEVPGHSVQAGHAALD
jgi:hypothetical protein